MTQISRLTVTQLNYRSKLRDLVEGIRQDYRPRALHKSEKLRRNYGIYTVNLEMPRHDLQSFLRPQTRTFTDHHQSLCFVEPLRVHVAITLEVFDE